MCVRILVDNSIMYFSRVVLKKKINKKVSVVFFVCFITDVFLILSSIIEFIHWATKNYIYLKITRPEKIKKRHAIQRQ